ncbi:hypothetical protein CI102_497 [Trichoderma harzianum]|uniref:Uncharacterized protein n=1 Tax=Trichoderma harzianum CBS 226.95 TaxID=983964 RepID=A0A2T4A0V8_TRIHA|nr:hypothetical protein M431DRAFT_511624 [Trichoderma harzianum CBS 226.95]PKK54820.1 hypothetical protein CI102_497 [Trichoderma harzianum]PTB50701.1 hypothetical protein M431DRAFT_511624 [Trichoderma harzianum CBS 226.95]
MQHLSSIPQRCSANLELTGIHLCRASACPPPTLLAYHLPKRQSSAILLSSPSPAITVCLSDALLSSSLHLGLSTASLQARKLRAVIGLTRPLQIQVPESPSPVSIAVLHIRPLQLSLSLWTPIVTTLPSRGSGRETARAPTAALTWRFSTLRAHATNARL